jgi:hypothetical protein
MTQEKDYCDLKMVKELESLGMNVNCKVVLLYDVQKWLRERKNIIVIVNYYPEDDEYKSHWYWVVYKNGRKKDISGLIDKTYEDALLEGIKKAIKILKEEK